MYLSIRAFGCLLSWCLAMTCALPLADVASADSIDEARAAYTEGRFFEAAGIGESIGTSEGLALAAGSLAIHAYFIAEDGEKEALFERAIGLAGKAVNSDPDNAEAHLQLAHAIGRHGQTIGSLDAANRGYAQKIRESTDTALRLDPELTSAYLSRAMWHAEIVHALGSFVARLTYGATEKGAIAAFERAFELAPHEKVVCLQYATGLLLLDEDENREKARGLLNRAIQLRAKDAHDRILHNKAIERLRTLDAKGG